MIKQNYPILYRPRTTAAYLLILGLGLPHYRNARSAVVRRGMNYKTLGAMLRQTFSAWNEHEAPRLGAALAFYTILSLAPLVILVTGIVALIFGHSTAQNQLLSQVDSMVGHHGQGYKDYLEHAAIPQTPNLSS